MPQALGARGWGQQAGEGGGPSQSHGAVAQAVARSCCVSWSESGQQPPALPSPTTGTFSALFTSAFPGSDAEAPGWPGRRGRAWPGFDAQTGCPTSVPPSPLVSFALISSASKARSDARFVYICLEGSGSKKKHKHFLVFLLVTAATGGGKKSHKTFKGTF